MIWAGWEGFLDASDERWRKVETGLLNLLWVYTFAFQMLADVLERFLALAFAHVDPPAFIHIHAEGDVMVAFAGRGFVDAELSDAGRSKCNFLDLPG